MGCKTARGNVRRGTWGDGRRSQTWDDDWEDDSLADGFLDGE